MGEGEIVEKKERTRKEYIIGKEKDILSLSYTALYIDNKAFVDTYETDKMHDEIQKHGKDNEEIKIDKLDSTIERKS